MRVKTFFAAAVLATVAACSSGRDTAPGAVSADENRQLNDAAAMLDANSVDANAMTADETPDQPIDQTSDQTNESDAL